MGTSQKKKHFLEWRKSLLPSQKMHHQGNQAKIKWLWIILMSHNKHQLASQV